MISGKGNQTSSLVGETRKIPDIGRLGFWPTVCKIYHDNYRCSGKVFQVLRFEGVLTPGIVRKALYWLQRRYPLLRAHFVDDARYYRFQVSECNNVKADERAPDVPLRIVNRTDDSQWEMIIEDEFSRDFDPHSQVLWQTIFLSSKNHGQCSELITFFHHSLSDGVSVTRFADDLLCFCNEIAKGTGYVPDMATLPLLPPPELMLPRISSSRKFLSQDPRNNAPDRGQTPWNFEAYRPLTERKARSLYFKISEDIMTHLKARCVQEHATLNSALIVALLLSAFGKIDSAHHVSFSFAFDLRTYCEPKVTSEHFGCYIMMVQAVLTLSTKISFWNLARNWGKELIMRILLSRKQGFLPKEFHKSFLSSIIESNLSKSDRRQHFAWGPALSDLGTLGLSEEYGAFRLNDIYHGTVQLSGLYKVFVGVATYRGILFCTLSYTEPLLSTETAQCIANSFVRQLENACESD